MCGIVGTLVFDSGNFEVTEPYITRMRDTMVHRGPDGAGVWISENNRVGLGHRRLSIIDLSTSASQPMCNEDGSIWISFNGEIYNHAEIRRELVHIGGHRWKTNHSDTEVILHAFEQWGIDCLEKFRGMFAIALWNDKTKELWLVRDRIGIKPLYYSIHDGRIVFASEIKALLQDHEQKKKVHEEAFYHYLSFLTTPAPQTLFDGIKKLPSGTWLRVKSDGQLYEHRYWDVLDHILPLSNITEEEICQRIMNELRDSVKLRKISDVSVGVFLSGGIDSSSNAALFSEGETRPIKTFTIGYEGVYRSYENEAVFARKMALKVGAEYHEKMLKIEDLIDFLPRMIHLQDEPIADPVCFPVYFVSRLARENGVTVCQVGEGADEIFCGYPGWITALHLQKLGNFPISVGLKRIGLKGLELFGKGRSNSYEWLRRNIEKQPIFWGGAEAFTEYEKKRLLSTRLRKKFEDYTSWKVIQPIYERFEAKASDKSSLNWMTYIDLNLRLPELLLMRVDKMTMGVGLEGRVPFLDHKFVELAMSIPERIKLKNGCLKYILKKSVRGLIPDELIDRKKQGFGVPIYEWFFDQLGRNIRMELEEFCNETDFFDKRDVMRILDQNQAQKAWYLYNFAHWWKAYVAS